MAQMERLEARVGHEFKRRELLEQALTHASLAYERGEETTAGGNERLEFLGDAVLGLASAAALFEAFPGHDEGRLTKLRALLVNRRHLAQVGEQLELGAELRLGRGEETSGGRKKSTMVANALEALIGAIYLDGGMEAAAKFVREKVVAPYAAEFDQRRADAKSELQERLQAVGTETAKYECVEQSGPPHARSFTVEVRVHGEAIGRGVGATKKLAAQQAAQAALERMEQGNAQGGR
jgi:ribonuclease-3